MGWAHFSMSTSAQLAGLDHLTHCIDDDPALVTGLFVKGVKDGHANFQTDQVVELKGSHRVIQAKLQAGCDFIDPLRYKILIQIPKDYNESRC